MRQQRTRSRQYGVRVATACGGAALAGLAALGIAGQGTGGRPARAAEGAPASAAAKYRDVVIGGVRWHGSLDQAKRLAARENRPVVLLSLFGRLDQEFC